MAGYEYVDIIPEAQDFWLTRDKTEGILADLVDVWVYRPEPLYCDDGDVIWIAPLNVVDRKDTHRGAIPLTEAQIQFGNASPASERECLRIERGPRAKS